MSDAVVNARQYCGGSEIGAGIGTANTVFDVPTYRGAAGYGLAPIKPDTNSPLN
jgi:hypothetical protein